MKVRLIPEGLVVEAYLAISSLDELLVRHEDPAIIKEKSARWEYRSAGSYEVVEEESG
jgi:hypothetical protein